MVYNNKGFSDMKFFLYGNPFPVCKIQRNLNLGGSEAKNVSTGLKSIHAKFHAFTPNSTKVSPIPPTT